MFLRGRIKSRLCRWFLVAGVAFCVWQFGALLLKKLPADDIDQHIHLNQPTIFQGYIEIHDVAVSTKRSVGKHGGDLKEITTLCDHQKDQCIGIFSRDGKDTFKPLSLSSVRLRNGKGRLYLKKEFASKVSFDKEHWTCVAALEKSEAAMTSSTTGCRLPDINPFDESVKGFFERQSPLECDGVAFTAYQGGILKIVNTDKSVEKITYQPVIFTERSYALGEEQTLPFDQSGVRLQHDFLKVTAKLSNGLQHVEYHAQVVPKPEVLERRKKNAAPLNIIILGLDGTSNAQFQRHFPKAYRFLRDDLEAYIFKGFSIVGEATTPQLTALLTGKTVEQNCQIHEGRSGYPGSEAVDSWPFIFKTLKDHGYATLFSEDAPPIGTFHLRLDGFSQPPADHYDRPFWWSNMREGEWVNDECLGPRPQHVVQLNYLKSIFKAYPDTPKFAFAFFTSLCHRHLNFEGVASQDILEFITDLKESGNLNNTMLIVMGDHGARFDEIRATLQGKIEECLPFLSMVLPEWFRKQNAKLVANLAKNTRRIISPLDVHATFMHLLYPDSVSKSKLSSGRSLFDEIPQAHSCEQASVPVHFCPCLLWKEVAKTHPHVQIGAHIAVQRINEQLAKHRVTSLCYELRLQNIVKVVQQMLNTKVKSFSGIKDGIGLGVGEPLFKNSKSVEKECMYEIQFRVKPSFALFEATIIISDGTFRVFGDISRINRYGSQPDCIRSSHPYLRKFCLCRRNQ